MATMLSAAGRDSVLSSELKIDMSEKLWKASPEVAPILAISSKLNSKPAHNTRVDHLEQENHPPYVTYTGETAGSPSSPIIITDYTYLRAGDLLLNPRTDEVIRVTTTPSSTSVAVTLGWGDSDAASLNNGDLLLITGSSFEEGADTSDARMVKKANVYNVTQIFRDWVKVTKTVAAMSDAGGLYGGDFRLNEQKEMFKAHKAKIEKAILFGVYGNTAGTTHYIRTMKGMKSFITTNDFDMTALGADFTKDVFDKCVRLVREKHWDKAPTPLLLVTSPLVCDLISQWAGGVVKTSPLEKEFGFDIHRILTPSGDVDIIQHPLLVDDDYLRGMGFLLDMSRLQWRPLRSTILQTNIQPGTADYYLDEYLTEASFLLANEVRHGKFSNIRLTM